MSREIITIIKPGIRVDRNAYWAMHYCAILETLYDQKTIEYGFQRDYMKSIEPTLENLVAKSGFAFFNNIQNGLRNFGLQVFLCHYLGSNEGYPIVEAILSEISEFYDYDFISSSSDYGVFVSCKDFGRGAQFVEEYNPVLLGHNGISMQGAGEKVTYADLCILLKGEGCNYGLLGEVEGNHGQRLYQNYFWSRKSGNYYTFGIGVKQRNPRNAEPPRITGEWIKTSCGEKYIISIESDNDVVNDFIGAIGTIRSLMTLGPEHRENHEKSLGAVLDMIRQGWNNPILDLIKQLRKFLEPHGSFSLGTNPLPTKTLPSIDL